ELLWLRGNNAELGGNQAQAGLADDEMDAGNARISREQAQGSLGIGGAACAGDADRDRLGFSLCHVVSGPLWLSPGASNSSLRKPLLLAIRLCLGYLFSVC